MSQCTLSFLMCYRTQDSTRAVTDITDILPNLASCFTKEEEAKVEVLIKIDKDDTGAHNLLVIQDYVSKFGFPIKVFITERGEGRHAFNYHYMHLFSQKNPDSKYIGFITDDVYVFPKLGKFFSEVEEDYSDLDYVIFHDSPFAELERHSTPFVERMKIVKDYEQHIAKICTSYLTSSYPIVSSKLFEVMGNLSWQINIDSGLGLLGTILYSKYEINIFRVLACKYFNRTDNMRVDKKLEAEDPSSDFFNANLTLHGSSINVHPYLLKLMEQQARNIYLNIKEEGVLEKYKG